MHAAPDRSHDLDARHGDVAEEEGRHAAQHAVGDGHKERTELGNDAAQQQPERAGVAGRARRAARERDDAVVLREGDGGRDAAQRGEDGVERVGEDAGLDADVVLLALWMPRQTRAQRRYRPRVKAHTNARGAAASFKKNASRKHPA